MNLSTLLRLRRSVFAGNLLSGLTWVFAIRSLVDTNSTPNTVSPSAGNGDTIGVTALLKGAKDTVTYSIVSQTVAGTFQVNSSTGVATVADNTKITTL